MHHLRPRGPQKNEDKQQISIEPRIQRRPTDVSPLIPKHPPIPIQEEIRKRAHEERRKRAGTQVPVKDRRRRKEDRRIPQIEPRTRESLGPVQHPHQAGCDCAGEKPPQDGLEEGRCEELAGPDERELDPCCVVGLEFLACPLAQRVGFAAAHVVEFAGDDPPHHAVVDGEGEHVGYYLDADDLAGWDVEVVADLGIQLIQFNNMMSLGSRDQTF